MAKKKNNKKSSKKTIKNEPKKYNHIKSKGSKVVTTRALIKQSFDLFIKNYKVFLTITVMYGILLFVFVQGPASINITDVKETVAEVLPEQEGNNTLIAGVLIGESVNVSEVATVYGLTLFLLFSMAMIWLLRMMMDGREVTVKQGFYKGMYGLIPVLLVGIVILVQLLPAAIGGTIYPIASLSGIAVTGVEQFAFIAVFFLLILVSIYFITGSIMALYIAALPDVKPLEALSTSRIMLKNRRSKVLLRMIFGAVLFGLISFGLLLLTIAVLPGAAVWVWWVIGVCFLPIAHTYLYSLYRSLL